MTRREILERELSRARDFSQQAASGQGFDPRGGTGVLLAQLATAGIGAFQRDRAEKGLAEEELQSQQAFEANNPELAGLGLSREGRENVVMKKALLQTEKQFSTPTPLSPQGKLLRDVGEGLVPASLAKRKLKSEEPLLAGAEINQIQNLSDRADAYEELAEQNIARGNSKIGTQQSRKARTLKKEFRDEERLVEKGSQKLSADLDKSGIFDLIDSLEQITSIINSNPKDIPGVGRTAVLPGISLSGEGKKLRQSVGTLRNSILKARSGGAVTPAESGRLLEELGTGVGRSDKQIRIGITNVLNTFNNKVKNITAGFRPEAVALLNERSGFDILERMNSLKIIDPLQQTGATQLPSDGGGFKILSIE